MEYWYDQGELVVVKLVKYNQRFKSIDSLGHTADWQKGEGLWWLKVIKTQNHKGIEMG